MSEVILECVKAVGKPFKSLVVDYFKFIKSYDANMATLLTELEILSSKKLDTDAKVMEGNTRLRVATRETKTWLRSLQKLIERPEMKKLMKEDRVAEFVVKMMEQPCIKRLLKEDKETFGIAVRVVERKCSQNVGNGGVVDAEEDADYKKIAKTVREVMDDTAEEFKKFVKEGDGAVVAVKLLNDDVLEMLRENDDEMANTLSEAEQRKELEHNDHEENDHEEDGDQPVDGNTIQKKLGRWGKYSGSVMAFLDDENFKKSLPNRAKIGLEVMLALRASPEYKSTVESAEENRCCVACFSDYCHRHDMSKEAEAMIKKIKAMIERCPSGIVTRPKRVDELETISAGFMEGLESREKLIRKLLAALRDDRVTAVGIYGMGGAERRLLC